MRAAVFAAVWAGLVATGASAQERSGQSIAREDCGACHAVGRADHSRQAKAPPFRTLGERYDIEGLAEALAEGISVGHPEMPVLTYPPDEVHRLIDYLKRLQPLRPNVERKERGS